MTLELAKDSIDVGIVVRDLASMLHFYEEVLGLPREQVTPTLTGAIMYRLRCGSSLLKLLAPQDPPGPSATSGGLEAASGFRWCTLIVRDIETVTQACADAGCSFPMPLTSPKPGTKTAIVADPEGNLVELIQRS
jgi:predicted enzyme related to lactoylglutathione lyase